MDEDRRWVSVGIDCEMGEDIQNAIWALSDTLAIERNDIQLFYLSRVQINDIEMQRIIHKQEDPDYESASLFPAEHPIDANVLLVFDGYYFTMYLDWEC